MRKTKEIINEERRFLRLCSDEYKDKIRKKSEMSVNDFNRFHCVLTTLRLGDYAAYFCIKLFPEILNQAETEDEQKRKNIDDLFADEDNLYAYLNQYQQWLYEFGSRCR